MEHTQARARALEGVGMKKFLAIVGALAIVAVLFKYALVPVLVMIGG